MHFQIPAQSQKNNQQTCTHADGLLAFLKLLADPDQVCPCLHGEPHSRLVGKPLIAAGWIRSQPLPVDNFTIFVEGAVMSLDIPKVDADRYPNLGASPRYFRDAVLRMPFHPHSLSLFSTATVS
jgi:hypothetical protein